MSEKRTLEQIKNFVTLNRPLELTEEDEDMNEACDIIEQLQAQLTTPCPSKVTAETKGGIGMKGWYVEAGGKSYIMSPKKHYISAAFFVEIDPTTLTPASPWIKITPNTMPKEKYWIVIKSETVDQLNPYQVVEYDPDNIVDRAGVSTWDYYMLLPRKEGK